MGLGWVHTLVTMRRLDTKWHKVVEKKLEEMRISFDVYCQGCGAIISNYLGYCFICVAADYHDEDGYDYDDEDGYDYFKQQVDEWTVYGEN